MLGEILQQSWFQFLSFLFGGGLIALMTWWSSNKRTDREYTDNRVDKVQLEVVDLRENVATLTKEKHVLDKELSQIKYLISAAVNKDPKSITAGELRRLLTNVGMNDVIVHNVISNLPIIIFIKEELPPLALDGPPRIVMFAYSQLYADLYLPSNQPRAYLHRTDPEIWGDEIAAEFRKGDLAARESLDPISVDEVSDSPFTGVRGRFIGLKSSYVSEGRRFYLGIGVHLHQDGRITGLDFLPGDVLQKIAPAFL